MTNFQSLIESLSPVMVALVAAYSSVLVAKLNKVQKDIKTEPGSKNLGESVDQIRTQVNIMSANQSSTLDTLNKVNMNLSKIDTRVSLLENQSLQLLNKKGS